MIYLGEVCVFLPISLIIFQSFRFICDPVKEDLTPPVAYYTLSTQYFKIVVLILRLFCSLCVAPNIQRTKVHVLYMCICVFVCVQSHRERPVWSEARLRGHTKDSRDATEASFFLSPESITQACRLN